MVNFAGTIEVLNRPSETFFTLTVHCFPCEPEAGPLASGMPSEALLATAITADPQRVAAEPQGDLGARFSAWLPPGHHQLCVVALPFVLEPAEGAGRARAVADPNNRFVFWPTAVAYDVPRGRRLDVGLKLVFPAGLGRFGERREPRPLLQRVGLEERAAYLRAVELAQTGELRAAFDAYGHALALPAVDRLIPSDAHELRLVLAVGQFKCLFEGGDPDVARSLLQHITSTLVPRVRLSEADPATAWDVMSTIAIAAARDQKPDVVSEALGLALEVLVPRIPGSAEGVGAMASHAVSVCLRAFATVEDWQSTYLVAQAAERSLLPLGKHPLLALPAAYNLEAYLASSGPGDEAQLISQLPPEGRAVLLRVARAEQLERLARALEPVPSGPARA